MYYLWGVAWFASIIVEEIVQILLLPKVFNWIDGGSYSDDDGELDVIHRLG